MTIEIDHIGVGVSDYAAAKKFYSEALKPLRIAMLMEFGDAAGFGADGKPFIWISAGGKTQPHIHLAIRAEDRGQVDAFYAAAMAAGGSDNGAPGLRPHYHQNYYGAFVLDPDGHNIEAVCHASLEEMAAALAPKPRAAVRKKAAARKKPVAMRAAARKPAKRAAAKKAPARRSAAKKKPARTK
jgi:catechol 2,3-dioxygenase-like lactoylglutathione lyase family enzyme